MNEEILCIGDNLPIMMGMESNMVDLIYTDPPFKSETLRQGNTEAHSFDDTWSKKEVDYAYAYSLKAAYPELWQMIVLSKKMHSISMYNYLAFMGLRIVQMHRLLKSTGSLYLHCDPSANFYLRIVLDCVFGKNNFRNEVVWSYSKPRNTKYKFLAGHDTIYLGFIYLNLQLDWRFLRSATELGGLRLIFVFAFGLLAFGFWAFGFWLLAFGLLAFGFWALGFGFWALGFGF